MTDIAHAKKLNELIMQHVWRPGDTSEKFSEVFSTRFLDISIEAITTDPILYEIVIRDRLTNSVVARGRRRYDKITSSVRHQAVALAVRFMQETIVDMMSAFE